MRTALWCSLTCALATSAVAADLTDLVGKWRWEAFTLEVRKCRGDTVCAKIVEGPKNVGMDVFASKLVAQGNGWVGQITDPDTKQIYSTRLQPKDKNRWQLDGCTAAKVCLTGEFVRVQ